MAEERIIPESLDADDRMLREHLDRYELASSLVSTDHFVVDAGCGVGYGSALLAEHARRVLGIDISSTAIEHARSHYRAANLEYVEADLDVEAIPECDVLVAFEFIEHIGDPEGFMEKARASARSLILVSTPVTPTTHHNEFHLHDWNEQAVESMFGDWVTTYKLLQSGLGGVLYGVWALTPESDSMPRGDELVARALEDQQKEIRRHQELVSSLTDWIEDLQSSKDWIESSWTMQSAEIERLESIVGELKSDYSELEAGKNWLAGQVDNLRMEVAARDEQIADLKSWIDELDRTRAWLESQVAQAQ